MSIGTGIVISVSFQKVDDAPNAKASAKGDHEGLQDALAAIQNGKLVYGGEVFAIMPSDEFKKGKK